MKSSSCQWCDGSYLERAWYPVFETSARQLLLILTVESFTIFKRRIAPTTFSKLVEILWRFASSSVIFCCFLEFHLESFFFELGTFFQEYFSCKLVVLPLSISHTLSTKCLLLQQITKQQAVYILSRSVLYDAEEFIVYPIAITVNIFFSITT